MKKVECYKVEFLDMKERFRTVLGGHLNTVCKTKIVMEQVVQRSKHKVVGGLHVVLIYHHPWS